ncbi:hypothetical protein CRI93_08585 [Longimonas halophila]|uniref:Uncharacterized protein n=1 Tax=Longimonas halophila TaxID=1469170 RepID=A0A2H3NL07_9BACT|nr:hypothetical protein CRI93_08585 [Longimonas halophila]
MSKFINIPVIRRTASLLVFVLLILSIVSKTSTVYNELAFSNQADGVIITVLITGLLVQSLGATGLYLPSWLLGRSVAFKALYLISGAELMIYIASMAMINQPDICDTIVGDRPGRMVLGQVCFLVLLGTLHILEHQTMKS